MNDPLTELQKFHRLRGDTYSSDEVLDLVGWAAAEIDRLRGELHACGLDNEAYFNRCEELAETNAKLRASLRECHGLLHGDRYSKKIRTALQIISDTLASPAEEGK
jgi:hypothetical protein